MKKIKFSLAEKRLFRILIVLAFIQLVIIFTFVYMLSESQLVDINETKQINITVDDIYYYRKATENQLIIAADSEDYLFTGRSTSKECSVHDIYESISIGDRLSLTYYETYDMGERVNVVVAANDETDTYRTLEEYNRGREKVPIFVIVLYAIIELVFVGVIFIYVWTDFPTIKGIYRKIKKQ